MPVSEVATGLLKQGYLFRGFHAFPNYLNSKLMGHCDNGFGDSLAPPESGLSR